MVFGSNPGQARRSAQLGERRFAGSLRHDKQLLESRTHWIRQALRHFREPGIHGTSMRMTGDAPQRAQRRKFKARGDQRLNGAVDEVREMRPPADESLHGLGGNRRRHFPIASRTIGRNH